MDVAVVDVTCAGNDAHPVANEPRDHERRDAPHTRRSNETLRGASRAAANAAPSTASTGL